VCDLSAGEVDVAVGFVVSWILVEQVDGESAFFKLFLGLCEEFLMGLFPSVVGFAKRLIECDLGFLCRGCSSLLLFNILDVGVVGFPGRVGIKGDRVLLGSFSRFLDGCPVFSEPCQIVFVEALEHPGDL